jgi:hypothetical protein
MKNAIIAIIATTLVVAIPTAFAHRGGMKGNPQAGAAEAAQEEGKEDARKGKGRGKGKGGPGRGGKGTKGGMPEEE